MTEGEIWPKGWAEKRGSAACGIGWGEARRRQIDPATLPENFFYIRAGHLGQYSIATWRQRRRAALSNASHVAPSRWQGRGARQRARGRGARGEGSNLSNVGRRVTRSQHGFGKGDIAVEGRHACHEPARKCV